MLRNLLVILLTLLSAAGGVRAQTTQPAAAHDGGDDRWRFHRPVVVAETRRESGADVHYIPMLVTEGTDGMLAVSVTIGDGESVLIHREAKPGEWKQVHALALTDIEAVPTVFAIDGDVCIMLGVERGRGGVRFVRFSGEKVVVDTTALTAPEGSYTMPTGAVRVGDQLMAFAYVRQGDKKRNRWLAVHSEDGGKTWSDEPVDLVKEDLGPIDREMTSLATFNLGKAGYGRFIVDEDLKLTRHVTTDGKRYVKEPVVLRDDMESDKRVARLPLQHRVIDGKHVLLYVAVTERGTTHYLLATSDDGKTWSKGRKIAGPFEVEDDIITLCPWVVSGERMLISHVAEGDGGGPRKYSAPLHYSVDGGRTWRTRDQKQNYNGTPIVSAVGRSTKGDRVIIVTSVADDRGGHYMTAQEWSAESSIRSAKTQPAEADEALRKRVDVLINELGHDRFEAREQASDRLRKIGPAATPQLKEAAETGDDAEVVSRAQRLIAELSGSSSVIKP